MSGMDQTIRTYNKIAARYNEVNLSQVWFERELTTFKSLLPRGKVIDIGCGAGRDASFFLENGYDYTGIDASKAMLEIARARNKRGEFIFKDFYKLDFPKGSFDGFWAAASLLHVPEKRINKLLLSIGEILKTGAIGFISVRKRHGKLRDGIAIEQKYGHLIKRHFTYYTKHSLSKLLSKAGFKLLKVYERYNPKYRDIFWVHAFVRKK